MLTENDLHGYQQRSITELYEHTERMAIIPMGGGKTVSTLTAFQKLQQDGHLRKGVILAPKRVAAAVWPAEVAEWEHLQGLKVSLVAGTAIQRAKALDAAADLYVVGIDNTTWLTEQMSHWSHDDPRLDLLGVDELSRYKKPNGKRSRALSIVADKFKNRWGLTGTPMPNNELDLFQPARILTRRRLWDMPFDQWRMKYFMPDDPYTQFTWSLREEWQEKIWSDVAEFSFTVPAEELPPQPELVPVVHYVDLPTRARNAFDEMLKHLITEAGGVDILAENAAVAAGKLDQIAQGFLYHDGVTVEVLHREKQRILADLVDGSGGQQIMVTYWFKEDLHAIQTLYPGIHVLGSDTTEAGAARAIDLWNRGLIQMLAVHPASAGHGLNLQKSHAGQIIHFCPLWSAELFDQVNARIGRQGNNQERVMNHLIVARGTFDEVKLARVAGKQNLQAAFVHFVEQWAS